MITKTLRYFLAQRNFEKLHERDFSKLTLFSAKIIHGWITLYIFLMYFFLFCFDIYAKDEIESDVKKNNSHINEISREGNSCIECHYKLKGKLRSVVIEWERSVHAKKGGQCQICHGGNPNSSDPRLAKSKDFDYIGIPEKKEITNFCGRSECHSEAYYQFMKSPHYQSVKKSGEPNCASCHGEHNVQRSSMNIMSDKACSGCHSVEYSREIIDTVFKIESKIDDIQKKLDFLESKNTDVENLKKRHFKTKSIFHQLVHVFSPRDMEFTKNILDLEVDSLKSTLAKKIALVERLNLLYNLTIINVIIIVVGFSIYFIIRYVRRRDE